LQWCAAVRSLDLMNSFAFLRAESASARKSAVAGQRRADRSRRHGAVRAHIMEARECGWVASSTLFATGDFFASQVAKRVEQFLLAREIARFSK
jgi:hypothetical protein